MKLKLYIVLFNVASIQIFFELKRKNNPTIT